MALRAIQGVGDPSRQFEEWTGYAYHVRRRLTPAEQAAIGDALDCRGTEEGLRRLAALRGVLPVPALRLAAEELGAEVLP